MDHKHTYEFCINVVCVSTITNTVKLWGFF